MTKRVQKAIDIFLDSLNSNTLQHGTCTACAVGNLVAAGCGVQLFNRSDFIIADNDVFITPYGSIDITDWANLFITSDNGVQEKRELSRFTPSDQKRLQALIDTTGFTIDELAEIEYTFETVARHTGVIFALEAVVKVMMSFDEVDQSTVKEVFTNKAEAIYA